MIRFVDLFAGIGGIRLALERACRSLAIGHECVLGCEIDRKAGCTYQMNFGEDPYGDVRLLTQASPFDYLLAGFPCQAFSYAGKMQGFGDTRGTLFFELERILAAQRPRAFLLENVRGLTSHDGGRTFRTILDVLHRLGYGVAYRLLNSSDFGVPQNRVRIYIFGLLGGTPRLTIESDPGAADSHRFKYQQLSLLRPPYPRRLVRDILEEEVAPQYYCTDRFTNQLVQVVGADLSRLNGVRLIDYRGGNSIHSWQLGIRGQCSQAETDFMDALIANRRKKHFGRTQDGKKLTLDQIRSFYNPPELTAIVASLIAKGYLKEDNGRYNPVAGNMSFEVFKFLDPDSISITLTSSDAHKLGVVQRNRPRHISPRECARLQGFPDDFRCHPDDASAYAQFGNSVSVPVLQALFTDFLTANAAVLGLS